jgi:hypothetical protein
LDELSCEVAVFQLLFFVSYLLLPSNDDSAFVVYLLMEPVLPSCLYICILMQFCLLSCSFSCMTSFVMFEIELLCLTHLLTSWSVVSNNHLFPIAEEVTSFSCKELRRLLDLTKHLDMLAPFG